MNYQFQINIWTDTRYVSATYVKPGSEASNDFEPHTFLSNDIDAEPTSGFVTSCLDTLVLLFTGHDPAMLFQEAMNKCDHEDGDTCECPLVSIPIPDVLAYHAVTLSQNILDISMDFGEWNSSDKLSRIRRYRRPDGRTISVSQSIEGGEPLSPDWEDFTFWRNRRLRKILNRWYDQGISLYAAWEIGSNDRGPRPTA